MRNCVAGFALALTCAAGAIAQEPVGTINHLLRLPIPEQLQFCGEPVPLAREEIAERLDLELVVTLGSPIRTTLWLKRIPRYFPRIEAALAEAGLPEDLKYVALIESNLRAEAASYAGAVGPWQFTRGTGSLYGLEQDGWRDERRDWEAATAAALAHLQDLRQGLGSWPLALAAYNAGRKRVCDAMEDQQEHDFFALELPYETERYVFRVLAAKLVVEDPEGYGINLEGATLFPEREVAALSVEVTRRQLPTAALAKASGVSYHQLLRLNPWISAAELRRGTYRLVVPAAASEDFPRLLARWEAANPEPQTVYYTVRKGDTLSAIARNHSVQLRDLIAWNGLSTRSIIRPGQELVIQTVD
jgi:hypothetical protein